MLGGVKKAGGFLVIAVVIVLITVSLGATSGAPSGVNGDPDCQEHPPISIVGDEGPTGFAVGQHSVTGEPIYRPGSGVVGGIGTAEDPYIIEGWCIDVPQDTVGIRLVNTTDHVVIRDNLIAGERTGPEELALYATHHNPVETWGIALDTTGNVEIADNTIRSLWPRDSDVETTWDPLFTPRVGGILAESTTQAIIRDNVFEAGAAVELRDSRSNTIHGNKIDSGDVHLVRSHGNEISENKLGWYGSPGLLVEDSNENRIRDNWGSDIEVRFSHGNIVEGNSIPDAGTWYGLYVYQTDGTRIVDNTMRKWHKHPVRITYASNITFEGNEVRNAVYDGMFIGWSEQVSITNNSMHDRSRYGLHVSKTDGVEIRGNNITDNWKGGIRLASPNDVTIEQNNIVDNGKHGLSVGGADEPVIARENWWGAASGPSGSVIDACTGTQADGDGDVISAGDGQVCFDPWLGDANPDAGGG